MSLDVDVAGTKLRFISAYAPSEAAPSSAKDQFFKDLRHVTNVDLAQHRQPIIMSDFNAASDLGEMHARDSDSYVESLGNRGSFAEWSDSV